VRSESLAVPGSVLVFIGISELFFGRFPSSATVVFMTASPHTRNLFDVAHRFSCKQVAHTLRMVA